jgi:hypothetical protein
MTRLVKRPKAKPAKTRHRPRAARRVTGEALIAAMQMSPDRGLDIAPKRKAMRVRKIAL